MSRGTSDATTTGGAVGTERNRPRRTADHFGREPDGSISANVVPVDAATIGKVPRRARVERCRSAGAVKLGTKLGAAMTTGAGTTAWNRPRRGSGVHRGRAPAGSIFAGLNAGGVAATAAQGGSNRRLRGKTRLRQRRFTAPPGSFLLLVLPCLTRSRSLFDGRVPAKVLGLVLDRHIGHPRLAEPLAGLHVGDTAIARLVRTA